MNIYILAFSKKSLHLLYKILLKYYFFFFVGQQMVDHIALASIMGLSTLMDTHKLESLCRQEFGKLFSHLVTMAAYFVNAKFESR